MSARKYSKKSAFSTPKTAESMEKMQSQSSEVMENKTLFRPSNCTKCIATQKSCFTESHPKGEDPSCKGMVIG